VIWVADDDTGDFLKLSTALAAITDATATKPYVIKIAPGVYTETQIVAMKNYVDVEGSGQNITTINCACSSSNFDATAAVISAGAITAEIRHLTINNTGGSNNMSVGVYTNGYSTDGVVTINNVTATAIVTVGGDGATSVGVYNDTSSPTMNNVTATANGGDEADEAVGVYNDSSAPKMTNVTATATGGTFNRGVKNDSSGPTMTNVTATATGGFGTYGVYNSSSGPTMNNVTATAKGGTNNGGVYNTNSTAEIRNSSLTGYGGTNNYGVYNISASTAEIRNSSITGTTNSIENSTSSALVADTMLDGTVVAGNGIACVGAHTAAFVALNAQCN
jgi:hypothetical protein